MPGGTPPKKVYRQGGKMPPKIEANWPKNARSTGRAQGALAGVGAALAATGVRTAREVSDAEYRGFTKGKVAGRQSDSSGRMVAKGPAAAKVAPKKNDLPSNASYFTKSLMK
jgi:hypothetical protein